MTADPDCYSETVSSHSISHCVCLCVWASPVFSRVMYQNRANDTTGSSKCAHFNHSRRLRPITCLLAVSMHEWPRMPCVCFAYASATVSLIACLCGRWRARQNVLWLLIRCLSFRVTEWMGGGIGHGAGELIYASRQLCHAEQQIIHLPHCVSKWV